MSYKILLITVGTSDSVNGQPTVVQEVVEFDSRDSADIARDAINGAVRISHYSTTTITKAYKMY